MSHHPNTSQPRRTRDAANAQGSAPRRPRTQPSPERTPQMGEGQHGPAQPIHESDWIGPNGTRDRDQD